ncbi:MAG: SHOCT domain-containing protein [Phycisphaerales bacterium]
MMACFQPLLARSGGNIAEVWVWVVVLLVVVVLGGVLVLLVRKGARGDSDRPALGLSLADLREMKADGRLTDEEFERAKAMVIGQLGGKVEGAEAERTRVQGRVVDGELRARPGYDLTGQRLPEPEADANPPDEAGGGRGRPDDGADRFPPGQ